MEKITWSSLEYEYIKKSPDWFWSLWIISAAIIFVSYRYDSILFSILVFLIAFTVSLQATRRPKLINFEIDSRGVTTKNKKYLFRGIDSYWIKESENISKIILKSKNKFYPLIIIPLNKSNMEEADIFLANYLNREEMEEPVTNKLSRYL